MQESYVLEENMEQKVYQGFTPQNQSDQVQKRIKGLTGSTLKMIAVISMFIDHLGAGVISRYITKSGYLDLDFNNVSAVQQWMEQNATLFTVYTVMRMIGRIAFPIYCFLLVEGFQHTRNRRNDALRLFIFALASELPFDLLFNSKWLESGYQNVFFTLFFGVVAMMGISWLEERQDMGRVSKTAGLLIVCAACMAAAEFLKTDYAAIGVMCIVLLYVFRFKKSYQIMAGCFAFLWELTAPLAFIPIGLYNGKRGWNIKYFFYLFYPMHLLLLYLLSTALGVVSYPAI